MTSTNAQNENYRDSHPSTPYFKPLQSNINSVTDEPNWEEQRLAIVHGRILHVAGGRHRMLLREDPSRRSGSSEPSVEPEPSEESEEEPDDGNGESFDTQLPTQHSVRI